MKALSLNNLPTPKQEEWKYTNLPKAVPANLNAPEIRDILIHKKRGELCEQPEDILFTATADQHAQPRLKIMLEAGAQLTVVERQTGTGAYWKNMVTEIEIGDNARLHHIRLNEDSLEGVQTNRARITMGRDAVYDGFSLNIGGKLSRHEIHAVLNGLNATVSFNGLNLLKGAQHGDTTIVVEHAAPHCTSNQFYRTLLDEQARGVFQGKVHVQQIAQKTDGYQLANTILLSPGAEMDTKPELEIYADDVKCSHGTTTGPLDETPMFYLRSRGLSEYEARSLLLQAFVDEVVDKIVDETLKVDIARRVRDWLKERLENL